MEEKNSRNWMAKNLNDHIHELGTTKNKTGVLLERVTAMFKGIKLSRSEGNLP